MSGNSRKDDLLDPVFSEYMTIDPDFYHDSWEVNQYVLILCTDRIGEFSINRKSTIIGEFDTLDEARSVLVGWYHGRFPRLSFDDCIHIGSGAEKTPRPS